MSINELVADTSSGGMGIFERYLSVWVALAIVTGVTLGQLAPSVPETLSRFEYAQVSIPIAILIWAMIFPMMAQIDFSAMVGVRKEPKGLAVTTAVNWLIKPFTMFAIAWFFLMVVFEPLIVQTFLIFFLASSEYWWRCTNAGSGAHCQQAPGPFPCLIHRMPAPAQGGRTLVSNPSPVQPTPTLLISRPHLKH